MDESPRGSGRRALLAVLAILAVVALIVAALIVPGYLFKQADPGPVRPVEAVRPAPPVEPSATIEPQATTTPEPIFEAEPEAEPEPAPEPEPARPAPTPPVARVPSGRVVVIDAGHQARANTAHEPIGPGASETKMKVTGGTQGVATRVPEHRVNLEVAHLLKAELEARAVTVIMVRETAEVDIANSERARIGNDANASLVIRLHCDGSNDPAVRGILTLVPSANQWTAGIVDSSRRAGEAVHAAVVAATGARDRGVVAVGNMSGFNWSTVPTIIVEMGVMTNADEDRLLSDSGYQGKLARGMADGAVAYLR